MKNSTGRKLLEQRYGKGCFMERAGIRKITPNECLALMGFPKSFKIADIPLKSAYKQIGNSVCVPIIKQIAKQIAKK